MTFGYEVRAELVDEGRLARARNTADADALRVAGVRQQFGEQLLRPLPVIGAPRLDEGDRPGDRRSLTGEHLLSGRGHRTPALECALLRSVGTCRCPLEPEVPTQRH